MTLIIKHNKIQRHFRGFLTLWLNGQTSILNDYHVAEEKVLQEITENSSWFGKLWKFQESH